MLLKIIKAAFRNWTLFNAIVVYLGILETDSGGWNTGVDSSLRASRDHKSLLKGQTLEVDLQNSVPLELII